MFLIDIDIIVLIFLWWEDYFIVNFGGYKSWCWFWVVIVVIKLLLFL